MPNKDSSTIVTGSRIGGGEQGEKSAHPCHLSVADIQQKWGVEFDFTLAAPSFVLPAGAAENSRFLANHFPEVALLFFETEACLAYTDFDLPSDLTDLDCSWHVHMPLDLRWEEGLDVVWQKIAGLLDKAAFLSPHAYVLHPPTERDMLVPLAARLRDAGVDPALFLLENIKNYSLTPIWEEAREGGYSTCLDIGHILAYGQEDVLNLPGLWETVRMLHVYGAEVDMIHQPLSCLSKEGRDILREMLQNMHPGTVVTLEVFSEAGLFESLDSLGELVAKWRQLG